MEQEKTCLCAHGVRCAECLAPVTPSVVSGPAPAGRGNISEMESWAPPQDWKSSFSIHNLHFNTTPVTHRHGKSEKHLLGIL